MDISITIIICKNICPIIIDIISIIFVNINSIINIIIFIPYIVIKIYAIINPIIYADAFFMSLNVSITIYIIMINNFVINIILQNFISIAQQNIFFFFFLMPYIIIKFLQVM